MIRFKKLMLTIVSILSMSVILTSVNAEEIMTVEDVQVNMTEVGSGWFAGEATGEQSKIKTYVTIDDGDIEQVYIASHNERYYEDPAVRKAIDELPSMIVNKNSLDDSLAHSDALETSLAIINSCKDGLVDVDPKTGEVEYKESLDGEELIPEWQKIEYKPGRGSSGYSNVEDLNVIVVNETEDYEFEYENKLYRGTGAITTLPTSEQSVDKKYLVVGDINITENTNIIAGQEVEVIESASIDVNSSKSLTLDTESGDGVGDSASLLNSGTVTINGTIVNNGTYTNDGLIEVMNESGLNFAASVGGDIHLLNDIIFTSATETLNFDNDNEETNLYLNSYKLNLTETGENELVNHTKLNIIGDDIPTEEEDYQIEIKKISNYGQLCIENTKIEFSEDNSGEIYSTCCDSLSDCIELSHSSLPHVELENVYATNCKFIFHSGTIKLEEVISKYTGTDNMIYARNKSNSKLDIDIIGGEYTRIGNKPDNNLGEAGFMHANKADVFIYDANINMNHTINYKFTFVFDIRSGEGSKLKIEETVFNSNIWSGTSFINSAATGETIDIEIINTTIPQKVAWNFMVHPLGYGGLHELDMEISNSNIGSLYSWDDTAGVTEIGTGSIIINNTTHNFRIPGDAFIGDFIVDGVKLKEAASE